MDLSLYRRILELVKPYWTKLLFAMICMGCVSLFTAAQAYLVQPALDDVFLKKDEKTLALLPIAIIILFLLKGIFDYGQSYLMNYVGLRIIADMRQRLYDHLQGLSLSFFTRTSTGVLISRITNDVNLLQASVSNAVTGVFKDVFTMIGLVGIIFYRNWRLAIIAFIVLPLALLPIKEFAKRLRKFSRRSLLRMGSLTNFLHETITGNRIVKAFNMEEYEKRRFAEENEHFFRTIFKRVRIRALSSPVMELIGGMGVAFIIWFGGYSVLRGELTPGAFFSFMTALFLLYNPIRDLNKVNLEVQDGLAAASRIFELLDTVPEIQDDPKAVALPPISKRIEFRNVNFRYDSNLVLKEIFLTVKAGEIIALVGMSGAGKTSLVNLLPRFYDVEVGQVLIDGKDIREVTLKSLREQIGLVTQQTILFNDTVRNNIAYGNLKRSDREIADAAKAANAHDFIMRLPGGYEAAIGEQGVKLSGGERQRISIARALLKDAPILILDEATSSLDSDSEAEVQKALEELMKGRTVLVIAHRLSTIRNAHRVVVLSSGRIVEQGSHDELMALGGEYRRLYELQFRDNGMPRPRIKKEKDPSTWSSNPG